MQTDTSAPAAAPDHSRPRIGRLAGNVGFLAARFSYISAKIAHRALAPFDLTTRSYSVLELAATVSGKSQRELGGILCLDPSKIVRLVDELETRGLVERVRDARDRRKIIVRATPAGEQTAREAGDALDGSYDELLSALSPGARDTVVDTLALLAFDLDASTAISDG